MDIGYSLELCKFVCGASVAVRFEMGRRPSPLFSLGLCAGPQHVYIYIYISIYIYIEMYYGQIGRWIELHIYIHR